MSTRIEHDLLGDKDVPADAYWGIHTQRALENFPISRTPISTYPAFIEALAYIKKACARANHSLGLLPHGKMLAISAACECLVSGQYHDQFPISVLQGGAGTSANMNANEVVANLALELMGAQRANYARLHPNDDVNMGQSTNDVYPSAIRLALLLALPHLFAQFEALVVSFEDKARQFEAHLKMGRTQLQEAVPMTLGQEMAAHATSLRHALEQVQQASLRLAVLNLGGTAIGTGINAHPQLGALAVAELSSMTGLALSVASDRIAATSDTGDFVTFSGALKRLAVTLSKTCNDLRLQSSGPRSGFRELRLPARQAGSSIMPGKVNPVIPEVVNQVAFEVIGNDTTVTLAAEAGQLQLNAFEPVIAWSLFKSLYHLAQAAWTLRAHCVQGIEADEQPLREAVVNSTGLVTALAPHIGYEKSVLLAAKVQASGLSVREVALREGVASAEQLDAWLSLTALTRTGWGV